MNVGTFVDDQRPLELAHVLRVDPEIGLQGLVDVHTGGTMKDPPDHTAELSAANLLSLGGMMVPKYSLTMSGYSRSAVSMSVKRTPSFSRSSRLR